MELALQTAQKRLQQWVRRASSQTCSSERAHLAPLLGDEGRYHSELSEAHPLLTEIGATQRAARLERKLGRVSEKQ